ncbi:MAG: ammonia-forming cytochrome c nitrite reductase subunit c552 [Polyangia bacterium]|jgi:nitrite reductase (cytochrome c-552)|nr:ammonia-forming cytochrome c nitrite reductase subunit c552 [Polyangia bacterium]
MSDKTKSEPRESEAPRAERPVWWRIYMPWAVFAGTLLATFLLGMLIISIMERRWEAQRPQLLVKPVAEWEYRSKVWGQNYPREYETFLKTARKDTRTAFGGSYLHDYLEQDPRQVVLFAGYPFSRDYKQARGHYYAVKDAKETHRTTRADGTDTGLPATCFTCKSPQVPVLMHERGIAGFYGGTFQELRSVVHEPIGCLDCHDPKTMNLRVSRPALRKAFARQGKDIDKAGHQEMRSLVCAQCHVEYYFANNPGPRTDGQTFGGKGNYLVFPWDDGTGVEAMEAYYAKRPQFFDWLHPISGTRMIKMQHPDYEMYKSGIHAFRGVSCVDCHMPYRTEGGVKFTNHHIQSPLLDIASSCGVCHRWSEEDVRSRVTGMQRNHMALKLRAEDALVFAHFDVAACREAGASDAELGPLRDQLWRAQLRWDYVSANNGAGFHSPQEGSRVLGTAIDLAQGVRVAAARLLASKGHSAAPRYPDVTTRKAAAAVILAFEAAAKDGGKGAPRLLGERPTPAERDSPAPTAPSPPAGSPEAPGTAPAPSDRPSEAPPMAPPAAGSAPPSQASPPPARQ